VSKELRDPSKKGSKVIKEAICIEGKKIVHIEEGKNALFISDEMLQLRLRVEVPVELMTATKILSIDAQTIGPS
jgi:hypothetical protein